MSTEITNGVIAHGKPPRARYEDPTQSKPHEANWLPSVASAMRGRYIRTRVPALPRPYDPVYEECLAALLEEPVDERTVAIGHSMGAYLWMRWLSENADAIVGKLIAVAPWLNPDYQKYEGLPSFEIDKGLMERCVGGLAVFYSSLDDDQAKRSTAMVQEALPDARYIDIPHYGHYMLGNTMTTVDFPELLDELPDAT